MGLFPGRTLEELDTVDVNRLLRAIDARRAQAVETRRRLFMAGKLQPDKIDEAEWNLIVEMDEAMAQAD